MPAKADTASCNALHFGKVSNASACKSTINARPAAKAKSPGFMASHRNAEPSENKVSQPANNFMMEPVPTVKVASMAAVRSGV